MKWLKALTGKFLSSFGIDISGRLGGSLQFFIYDVIKIFVLLSVLIFVISYIQSYFPPERTKKILGRFKGVKANLLSALLGTVTPFCSCSSIPLFIGFTRAGLSLGVTFSFLISSPLVDLGSLILLVSIFGTKIAVAYVVVGLVLAVAGGSLIEALRLDTYIEEYIKAGDSINIESEDISTKERIEFARDQVIFTVRKVALYIFIGVGIGALIHNWIPQNLIEMALGNKNSFSVVIATFIGIPIYSDIFGTIPIAEALYAKGVGLGTIMSLMMAVTALSLPSIILLRKAVKPPLLILFISIVAVGIMLIGYLFNAFAWMFVYVWINGSNRENLKRSYGYDHGRS
ncbi:MAG: permease [Synergistaceae bacterium]|nr:permease [Synergistaceae bacterium]